MFNLIPAKKLSALLLMFGILGYASADYYPGDVAYNNIVQEIYNGVTSDNIVLTYLGNSPIKILKFVFSP